MTVHKDRSIHVIHKTRAGTFSCEYCERSFQLYSQLKLHKKKVHQTTINYECNRCEKSFSSTYKLRHHYRRCPIEKVDIMMAVEGGNLESKTEMINECEFEVEFLEEAFCSS
jgi:hypothetical protein